jgi:hypothetical protein
VLFLFVTHSKSASKKIYPDLFGGCLSLSIFDAMKHTQELKVGSKLYWVDAPEVLAGIVVRFTNKRDVVINFNGEERNFSIKLASQFIIK